MIAEILEHLDPPTEPPPMHAPATPSSTRRDRTRGGRPGADVFTIGLGLQNADPIEVKVDVTAGEHKKQPEAVIASAARRGNVRSISRQVVLWTDGSR